jgi:hypothetical protein
VLAAAADLACGYDLLQQCRAVIRTRELAALDAWLAEAQASGLAPFISLANGIRQDRAAAEAALTMPWSNGTEGHVHRLKLIKRQAYGRASVRLLRRPVLAPAGGRGLKLLGRAQPVIPTSAGEPGARMDRQRSGAVVQGLLGADCAGVVGSDRWSAYRRIAAERRARCHAHRKLELQPW